MSALDRATGAAIRRDEVIAPARRTEIVDREIGNPIIAFEKLIQTLDMPSLQPCERVNMNEPWIHVLEQEIRNDIKEVNTMYIACVGKRSLVQRQAPAIRELRRISEMNDGAS